MALMIGTMLTWMMVTTFLIWLLASAVTQLEDELFRVRLQLRSLPALRRDDRYHKDDTATNKSEF